MTVLGLPRQDWEQPNSVPGRAQAPEPAWVQQVWAPQAWVQPWERRA